MGNRLKVGNKEISEESQVVTNIKTIFWFLGGVATIIIALTTYFYISLGNQIDANTTKDIERSKNLKQEILIEVDEIAEDTEKIEDDVWEIKGDVKLLLDRTNGTTYDPEPTYPTPASSNGMSPNAGGDMSPPPLDSLDSETSTPE